MLEIREKDGEVRFHVKVQARARQEDIEGEHGGALKIRLTAPPIEGRANQACCALLAKRLKVPQASVKIVAGEHAPRKIVAITGVTAAQVRELVRGDD